MELKIAICDDEKDAIDHLIKLLGRFESTTKYIMDYTCFTSGEEFIQKYKKGLFNIVFMDMQMKSLNGLEAIRKIRQMQDNNLVVLFTTSFPDYMSASFEVFAAQYLMKPLEYDTLEKNLINIIEHMENDSKRFLVVPVGYQKRMIYINELMYAQTKVRKGTHSNLTFYMENEEISIKGHLKDYEEILLLNNFIPIHRSTIVNYRFIKKFSNRELELRNGQILPISRLRASEIMNNINKVITSQYV